MCKSKTCVLTFDIEDWFQVENLRGAIPRGSWDSQQLRVLDSTEKILTILDEFNIKATFFILGWIAERMPRLVRRISDVGHEIASHGYNHELIPRLTLTEFRKDIVRAKSLLEDITGRQVIGYRAPAFSITDSALDVLVEMGFIYDSSLYPVVVHDRYGSLSLPATSNGFPERPFEIRTGFYEVPVSVLNVFGLRLPWGGGGYFRLLPYYLFTKGLNSIVQNGPYVFYLHPWEIDVGQPRLKGIAAWHRFRHYVGLRNTESKLRKLIGECSIHFVCKRMVDLLNEREG